LRLSPLLFPSSEDILWFSTWVSLRPIFPLTEGPADPPSRNFYPTIHDADGIRSPCFLLIPPLLIVGLLTVLLFFFLGPLVFLERPFFFFLLPLSCRLFISLSLFLTPFLAIPLQINPSERWLAPLLPSPPELNSELLQDPPPSRPLFPLLNGTSLLSFPLPLEG